MKNNLKICVAGATGWAGSQFCRDLAFHSELEITCALSRTHAGKDLRQVLNYETQRPIPIFEKIEQITPDESDVLLDYTSPLIAKHNIQFALERQKRVVVGTSGLSDKDYEEIQALAISKQSSVLAVGNFAISVVLLNKFAELATKYFQQWEIIDYADSKKIDSPSGSALELCKRLEQTGRKSRYDVPIEKVHGYPKTRGEEIGGQRVHSVRLPGYIISLEAIFGGESEKFILRHEAGTSAKPYVAGAILAIKKVGSFVGLKRGLDSVMEDF